MACRAAAAPTRPPRRGFLTGLIGKMTDQGIEAGPSIDQIAAQQFGQHTQLASLELSADRLDLVGTCDNTTCAWINSLSWASATTQVPGEDNPRVVFERLFGDSGTTDPAERLAGLRRRRSILDSVTEAVSDLEQELGSTDRSRLDEYLTAVRDVERRIQKAEEQSATELPVVSQPAGIPSSYEEYCALMFDLQVLAYQSDLTTSRDVHDGPRVQRADLPANRRHRGPPSAIAPPERSREDSAVGEGEYLSRLAVRVIPEEATVDSRWRRISVGPYAAPVRSGHGRQQQP